MRHGALKTQERCPLKKSACSNRPRAVHSSAAHHSTRAPRPTCDTGAEGTARTRTKEMDLKAAKKWSPKQGKASVGLRNPGSKHCCKKQLSTCRSWSWFWSGLPFSSQGKKGKPNQDQDQDHGPVRTTSSSRGRSEETCGPGPGPGPRAWSDHLFFIRPLVKRRSGLTVRVALV